MLHLSPSRSEQGTHARAIHRFVLSGRSVRCAVAFILLGLASALVLMLTILSLVDTTIGMSLVAPQFNFNIETRLADYRLWFPELLQAFDAMRPAYIVDPAAWATLLVFLALIFAVYYRRFDRVRAQSLLEVPAAAEVAATLLASFGHFRTIAMPQAEDSKGNTAFFAKGRVFYAPRAQLSRILKGRPSENQQRRLQFFMAHEYAHAVTRDNLAHTLFSVLVLVYLFGCLASLSPLLLFGAALIGDTPFGLLLQVIVASLFLLFFWGGIMFSFQGLLISYIKAREFFADEAAYHAFPEIADPYGHGAAPVRPDGFSVFSRNISGYERGLHRLGQSLHARNLLVFLWPFVLCIRTLFILCAPRDWCLYILAYDGIALICFALLYWSLPPRPPARAPVLPWLAGTHALLALLVCGPGVVGDLRLLLHVRILSDVNAMLLAQPLLVVSLGYLFWCLAVGVRRLVCGGSGEVRQGGRLRLRSALWLVIIPAATIEATLIFILIICLYVPMVMHVVSGHFLQEGPAGMALYLLLVLLGLGALCIQLNNQIRRSPLSFVLSASFGAFVLLASLVLMAATFSNIAAFAQNGIVVKPDYLPNLQDVVGRAGFFGVLRNAAIWAIFYLVLQTGAFWAKNKLHALERSLEWGSYR